MNNLIYIAGPITNGGKCSNREQWNNVFKGMDIYFELIKKGYAPILPHFSFFFNKHHTGGKEMNHDDWLELDFHYIEVCDYFFFIGPAKGSLQELEFAEKQNKIIFNHDNVLDVPAYPPVFKSLRMGEA